MSEKRIELNEERDVLTARSMGRELARNLGFGSADQTRLATAISELGRNVIQYAAQGSCLLVNESNERMLALRVVVEDHGPGIPDVEKAMQDGFSTNNSLGAGLPGTRRLVQEFVLKSEPGHTVVTIRLIKRNTQ